MMGQPRAQHPGGGSKGPQWDQAWCVSGPTRRPLCWEGMKGGRQGAPWGLLQGGMWVSGRAAHRPVYTSPLLTPQQGVDSGPTCKTQSSSLRWGREPFPNPSRSPAAGPHSSSSSSDPSKETVTKGKEQMQEEQRRQQRAEFSTFLEDGK